MKNRPLTSWLDASRSTRRSGDIDNEDAIEDILDFALLGWDIVDAHADKLLPPGLDLESNEGLAEFMVRNSRRLGTAGKIMFPIPNRRLSKRLYRVGVPTRVILAGGDRLIHADYGEAWRDLIPGAGLITIDRGGHLINLENPDNLAAAISGFLTP